MVLTSASNRWRQFKSDLTRKYIMPFKDEAEALKNPPEDYGFIKQQHWKQFVNGRLTKEFQVQWGDSILFLAISLFVLQCMIGLASKGRGPHHFLIFLPFFIPFSVHLPIKSVQWLWKETVHATPLAVHDSNSVCLIYKMTYFLVIYIPHKARFWSNAYCMILNTIQMDLLLEYLLFMRSMYLAIYCNFWELDFQIAAFLNDQNVSVELL